MATQQIIPDLHELLIESFIEYLRSGKAGDGLFAEDVIASIHVGGGQYQVRSPSGLERELQQYGGPIETEVLARETTPGGFVLEFTQRSPRGDLYEEMVWAEVDRDRVRQIRWYCTGIVREPRRGSSPA